MLYCAALCSASRTCWMTMTLAGFSQTATSSPPLQPKALTRTSTYHSMGRLSHATVLSVPSRPQAIGQITCHATDHMSLTTLVCALTGSTGVSPAKTYQYAILTSHLVQIWRECHTATARQHRSTAPHSRLVECRSLHPFHGYYVTGTVQNTCLLLQTLST